MKYNELDLKTYPYDGIISITPDGHYLQTIGDEACIYSVGCFQGFGAYDDMLPGYRCLGPRMMHVKLEAYASLGKFWIVMYERIK